MHMMSAEMTLSLRGKCELSILSCCESQVLMSFDECVFKFTLP